jgi:probable rRNA maturation factor
VDPRPIAIRTLDAGLRIDRRAITRALRLLDGGAPGRPEAREWALASRGELSVVFLPPAALARLHARFLSDPSETDVITFPGDPALGTAGEICISARAAARFAKKRKGDFSGELTLYLVHGWLHLAGYDDRKPKDRRAMRRAEARAMRFLRAAGAIPKFRERFSLTQESPLPL